MDEKKRSVCTVNSSVWRRMLFNQAVKYFHLFVRIVGIFVCIANDLHCSGESQIVNKKNRSLKNSECTSL